MKRNGKRWIGTSALAGALTVAAACAQAPTSTGQDAQIQADVMKALDKKQFGGVQTNVQNGMVTLTGSVPTYADKEDADKRAHHRKNVHGVDNEIQVAAGEIDDATLQKQLLGKVEYDRIGYGTTAFNAISVSVQNGVATLGGVAYGPVDKDSALSVAANTRCVRDVIDNIEVAPLSPFDDGTRIAEFRAIYGFPSLSKYAVDPAKPIRITVISGNVTLYGVVDTQADKNAAGIRANSVPNVFKVTNNLQVAAPSAGK